MRPFVLSAAFLAAAVRAATPGAVPAQDQFEFDIPAGPLDATLLHIGRHAGVYVSFQPQLVQALGAPAIRGRHTLLQAVAQALEGSGLAADLLTSTTLTVRPASPSAPGTGPAAAPPAAAPEGGTAGPTLTLPRVEITGIARPRDDGLRAVRAWSATRDDTALADLPQAVSVLTPQALALQGTTTSTEALGYVTGLTEVVDIAATGGRFMPSHQVRGFSAAYALSGVGTSRAVFPADQALIERIEVPKGPSGVIAGFAGQGQAGASEFGGVINLVRKQAGQDLPVQLNQTLDSADGGTLRLAGDVGGAWGDGRWWRLATYASQSGRTEGGYERRRSAGLLATATWQRGDFAAEATLQADGNRGVPAPTSRGGLRLLDGGGIAVVPLEDGVAEPLDPRDRLLARGVDLDLDLSWRLAPKWRMSWKGRAEKLRNDWRRSELLFNPLETAENHRLGAMQWTLTGDLSTGPAAHRLTLGLDLQRKHLDLLARSGAATFAASTDELRQTLLLQDQVSLSRWKLRLAVQQARVPRVTAVQDGVPLELGKNSGLNGDAGLLFQWRPAVAFYAGAQSTIEAGQYLAQDFVLFDGSQRPPARMAQVQLGSRVNLLDGRLALAAEAFRIRKLDRGLAIGGELAAVAGRYVNGLELELSGRPSPAWDVSLGFAYMQARDLNYLGESFTDLRTFESRTAGIPQRSLQLLAGWRLPERLLGPGTRLGLGLRATSDVLVGIPDAFLGLGLRTDQYVLPGGGQLDVSLERLFGPWAVKGFVHNLTDQRLHTPTYEVTYLPLRPARHFGLSLTYSD